MVGSGHWRVNFWRNLLTWVGRRPACVLAAVLALAGLTGCGPEAKVPNVVGMALDDAHNELKDSGFEDFEDDDLFGDRTMLLDANWVVLEQEPAAGKTADLDPRYGNGARVSYPRLIEDALKLCK